MTITIPEWVLWSAGIFVVAMIGLNALALFMGGTVGPKHGPRGPQ